MARHVIVPRWSAFKGSLGSGVYPQLQLPAPFGGGWSLAHLHGKPDQPRFVMRAATVYMAAALVPFHARALYAHDAHGVADWEQMSLDVMAAACVLARDPEPGVPGGRPVGPRARALRRPSVNVTLLCLLIASLALTAYDARLELPVAGSAGGVTLPAGASLRSPAPANSVGRTGGLQTPDAVMSPAVPSAVPATRGVPDLPGLPAVTPRTAMAPTPSPSSVPQRVLPATPPRVAAHGNVAGVRAGRVARPVHGSESRAGIRAGSPAGTPLGTRVAPAHATSHATRHATSGVPAPRHAHLPPLRRDAPASAPRRRSDVARAGSSLAATRELMRILAHSPVLDDNRTAGAGQ